MKFGKTSAAGAARGDRERCTSRITPSYLTDISCYFLPLFMLVFFISYFSSSNVSSFFLFFLFLLFHACLLHYLCFSFIQHLRFSAFYYFILDFLCCVHLFICCSFFYISRLVLFLNMHMVIIMIKLF